MAKRVSGKRYAQALFELAEEQEKLQAWHTDLQAAAQVLADPEYDVFLRHAKVPNSTKLDSLNQTLRDIDPMVRNLVALLVLRGASHLVAGVAEDYGRLLDAHLGRQRVEVTSAVPLEPAEVEDIRRFVTGMINQEVIITSRVDETILGGVIIQVGDRMLDGSTRNRLETLRKRLLADAAAGR